MTAASMGRVPPDEGEIHLVRLDGGTTEWVSDEELETVMEWLEQPQEEKGI